MLEIAQKVLAITGSRSQLVTRPLPSDDPRQRCPDITLAREKLGGWQPSVPLDEGLALTVAYFRKTLGIPA
jgi:UDP-glucuronate decarboxylase